LWFKEICKCGTGTFQSLLILGEKRSINRLELILDKNGNDKISVKLSIFKDDKSEKLIDVISVYNWHLKLEQQQQISNNYSFYLNTLVKHNL